MDIQAILQRIPDYTHFLTVDELDASTRALAEEFPGVVEVFEAGVTGKGHPVLCIKIGKGARNALMFGCPHPNEPIGAMMLEFLSRELAQNDILRDQLNFTWYIIKCIDIEGTRLNEGWFKGPFTLYQYARNYYRPAMQDQVEWTFPVDYKALHFDKPLPETQALMRVIEQTQPEFIYSLHNAGFGGAFWYMTHDLKPVYDKLPALAQRAGVPLQLGEPEVPYARAISPAVYSLITVEQSYDFYEKFAPGRPEEAIRFGASSMGYARRFGNAFGLVSELPYFYDGMVDDIAETDQVRREAIIQGCGIWKRNARFVRERLERIKPLLSDSNPFYRALSDFLSMGEQEFEAKEAWAKTNPALLEKAKRCEVFDNLYASEFYGMLQIGLLVRMPEYERENTQRALSDVELANLLAVSVEAYAELKRISGWLETQLNYSVIPIRKLVGIQLESGLIAAQAINAGQPD